MQLTRRTDPKHTLVQKPKTLIPDVGILLLDSSLTPIAFDSGTAALFSGPSLSGIMEEILRVLRSRKPTELSAVKTVFRRGKSEYICRAHLVEFNSGFMGEPIVAVHWERDASTSNAMHEAAAKYRLTEREQEALKGLSLGLTNKELAERMNISPNTVRAFLRLIMVKMGVTTRSGIVAKILQDREKMDKVVSLSADKELAV